MSEAQTPLRCARCGAESQAGSRFCRGCGARLVPRGATPRPDYNAGLPWWRRAGLPSSTDARVAYAIGCVAGIAVAFALSLCMPLGTGLARLQRLDAFDLNGTGALAFVGGLAVVMLLVGLVIQYTVVRWRRSVRGQT